MTKGKMTLKQAVDLCKTVFGSANSLRMVKRGMEYDWQGGYTSARISWKKGNMAVVEIRTEGAPGALEVVYNLDTMSPEDGLSDSRKRARDAERLRDWVLEMGAERCCERIKKIWEARYDDR